MSTFTILDGIEASKQRLAWERQVAERYPDAFFAELPDGQETWMSPSLVPTEVRIFETKDGSGRIYFCGCSRVGEDLVFTDPDRWQNAATCLWNLQKNNPKAYEAIVHCVMLDICSATQTR
jgi:hypothetical protein